MLVLAHRGYHAEAPENTMAAFAAAAARGVDGIETDVRLTADGAPVLFHDDRLRRGPRVASLTRAELEARVGHAVPLLDEALEAWPRLLWNVEIKTPEALGRTVQVLRAFQNTRRLLVTSFDHDVVARASQVLKADCGLLFASRPRSLRSRLAHYQDRGNIRSVVWHARAARESAVAAAASVGWKSLAYGADSEAEHRRLAALGLAGIITDYPEWARA